MHDWTVAPMSIRSAIDRLRRTVIRTSEAFARRGLLPCPICRDCSARIFDGSRTPNLLICRDCRHVYWGRFPTSDELETFYREDYGGTHGQVDIQQSHRCYYRGHVEELIALRGLPKHVVCLIDYGSSIPVLVEEAKSYGVARPIAVELDILAFEYADQKNLEIVTPAQYVEQVPDGSVDIIRFSHVLEHLIDPKATIELAARKLREGGILYITQPGFPVFRAQRADHPIKDSVFPSHLHYFSPISLVRLVDGLRLQVEKLFSVTRCDEVYHELAHLIDLSYARKRLAEVSQKGERVRGERANYPFYSGENSAIYLRKTG